MDNKTRRYTNRLTWELRKRDVSGDVIGDALAQVESHCAESGADPETVFGPVSIYARSFAPAVPTSRKWLGYLVQVLAGALLGTLIGIGVAGIISGEDVLWGVNATLVTIVASVASLAYGATLVAVLRRRILDPRKDI